MEHPESASFGQASTLLANIKLGWKGLPEANTLADQTQIMDISLVALDPGVNVTKLFFYVNDKEAK